MSDVAAATPETDLNQFYESQPTETPAEETAPAEAPAAQPVAEASGPTPTTPDFWSEKVEDEDLPPSLRGITRKEYFDKTKDLAAKAHQAGYQKNEAEARARVAEATLAAYQRTVQQPQQPANPYQSFGVSENDAMANPMGVLARVPQVIDQTVRQSVEEVRQNEVVPLRNDLLRIQGDTAQETARAALGIDKETWSTVRPNIAAIMAANNFDPRDAEAWSHCASAYRQQAARMIPQPVKTEATASPAGNAKPAANGAPQKKVATTGNKHIDSALREQLDVWNGLPGAKKMSLDDFADMIQADKLMGGAF